MSAPVLPGYRLRRLVHRGHSFEVWDALSDERACPVVVKRSRPAAAVDARKRLVREGRLLTHLTHPHIVRGYEVLQQGDRVAVVIETLPGQTLGHLIETEGPLSREDVAELGRQLASALTYLHRHRIVHGDLKPANVINSGGIARLIDLSLAGRPRRWRSDAGTPGYLAPEQASRGTVSPATDVWGLGLLLAETACGDEPYPVGDPRYREGHGPVERPELPGLRRRVGADMAGLIQAMTAMAADARPSLAVVRQLLQDVRPDRPPEAREPSSGIRPTRPNGRSPAEGASAR